MIISIKSVSGDTVHVTEEDLSSALLSQISEGSFSLLGMSLQSISRLRSEYLKLGGSLPITPDSIDLVFKNTP